MSKLSSFLFNTCAAMGVTTMALSVSNIGVGLHHGFEIGKTMKTTGVDFNAAAHMQEQNPDFAKAYQRHKIAVSLGLRIATELQGIYPKTPS